METIKKTSIIELKNVYKGYKAKPNNVLILKNVNLSINKGEFVVVFGPSGSGKSTILNLILGLEKATQGDVILQGENINNLSEDELADIRKGGIGIVYQQPYWVKSLTVVENIALPLMLKGISKPDSIIKAQKILDSIGLLDWAEYHPHELSSGQQQKVSLARALVTEPSIIIADEPTGNLDYKSGQVVSMYLKELANAGKTVIMVTHNLDNLDFADRVVSILDGKVNNEYLISNENKTEVKNKLINEKPNSDSPKEKVLKKDLDVLINDQIKMYDSLNRGSLRSSFAGLYNILKSILLGLYLVIFNVIDSIFSIPHIPGFKTIRKSLNIFSRGIVNSIDRNSGGVSYFDIFKLSTKTLFAKRNRTIITIGGIAFGIGFTAFLISLGYGLEQLVISRSTQLEQLKQVEVYPPLGESVDIDETTIAAVSTINNVESVYPVINVAGKVNYQNSNIDVVVYGVSSNYLNSSGSTILKGGYFEEDKDLQSPSSYPVSYTINDQFSSERKAVVNQAFLDLIGLNIDNSVGKIFKLRYVPVNDQVPVDSSDLISYDYQISGIISSSESPVIYTPLSEVRKVGIDKYSQLRIVATNQSHVSDIRLRLNALGYRTSSVQDTVKQIESFFSSARLIFAAIGFVALFVGSLGMFNTLTVSLLERTKEVGLLKTMGMKSKEVRELFLSEAIIMGLYGGILGILIGLLGGYISSSIVSLISVLRGSSSLAVTYLPFSTALLIIIVSAFTGIATGFYPSRRATKISALDALRYE